MCSRCDDGEPTSSWTWSSLVSGMLGRVRPSRPCRCRTSSPCPCRGRPGRARAGAPDGEELAEGEGLLLRRLHVDDPVRGVRVEPHEAAAPRSTNGPAASSAGPRAAGRSRCRRAPGRPCPSRRSSGGRGRGRRASRAAWQVIPSIVWPSLTALHAAKTGPLGIGTPSGPGGPGDGAARGAGRESGASGRLLRRPASASSERLRGARAVPHPSSQTHETVWTSDLS